MKTKLNSSFIFTGFALLAGALLVFAFAPFYFYPLAIFCPAVLLYCWLNSTAKQAFFYGYAFGIGFFGVGVSWVFISIHIYGQTPILLAGLITAIFIGILALFIALAGFLFNFFFPINNHLKCLVIFPSLWALSEWLRSWFLTGFPWLLISNSQVSSPFAGYAPIFGEYGLAFLITFAAGLLVEIYYSLTPLWLNSVTILQEPRKKKSTILALVSLLALICLIILGQALRSIQWSNPVGKPLQVSLIQANIPQSIKWKPDSLIITLDTYLQLTQAHWQSRLIIWPEAAIPLLQKDALPFLKRLQDLTQKKGVTLITGIPIQYGFNYYNGMIALGVDKATYLKQRLVIFGEYLPRWIAWARGLMTLLDIPMSSFSPGPIQQPPFKVAGVNLGTFICYEIAYSGLVRHALPHSQLLLTINDDAWFGDSFALAQHLQIGQFQALASGRYLLFLSNTGLTAIVTPKGQIQTRLPPFEIAVLTGSVFKMMGTTPWVRYGDHPIIIFLVGFVILCYAYQYYWASKKKSE